MKVPIYYRWWLLVILFIYALGLASLKAITPGSGVFAGRVIDADSGEPVGFVFILIDEIHFWQQIGADGFFRFENVPVGSFKVRTFRLGYQEAVEQVIIREGEITEKVFRLKAAPIMLDQVLVSAFRTEDVEDGHPDLVVADRKLRQNLGMTVAKTLENEPGIDQITMGPAPARPVLRGMAGDRLLILADGERTGDLSATSSDHAVAIEPLTTTRIEIIRGPEALMYGANVMAGAINVVRESVPRLLPPKTTGAMTLQGESVNRSGAAALEWLGHIGKFAARLDFSHRAAADMQTPAGRLLNTSLQTHNGSLGLSLVQPWGHIGVAAGFYDSDYGIPPDPIAGHPKGVDISLLRQHIMSQGEYAFSSPLIRHLFFKYQYSRYQHQEYESTGVLGMEFGVVTHHATAIIHFGHYRFLNNARIGVWGEYRNYASGGLSFTPAAQEYSGAAYCYNEFTRGRWSLNSTLRFDRKFIQPAHPYSSMWVGEIRNRHFSGFSAAMRARYQLFSNGFIGLSGIRTFRAPGVEELFSEGPHLAAYAYEVGNADLQQETGYNFEMFSEAKHGPYTMRAAVFYNHLHHYIFPRNTGQRSLRRADLFTYQYQGLHALMSGFEAMVGCQVKSWLAITAQVQYIRGDLLDENRPMPRIPPLTAKIDWQLHHGPVSIVLQSKGAAKQDRVDQFEKPTSGFVVHDLIFQYVTPKWRMLHTVSLTIENLENKEYRHHLNRIKEIMPEAGRNIRILYKAYF